VERLSAPAEIKNIITAGGSVLNPTSRTLEEVLLQRKFDASKQHDPKDQFCNQLTDKKYHTSWHIPNKSIRERNIKNPGRPKRTEGNESSQLSTGDIVGQLRNQLDIILKRLAQLEEREKYGEINNELNLNNRQKNSPRDEELKHPNQEKQTMMIAMDGIQNTLHLLEQAFDTTEENAEMQALIDISSATRVQSFIRFAIQRCRYLRASASLRRWRFRNGVAQLKLEMETIMKRNEVKKESLARFLLKREHRLKSKSLIAWNVLVIEQRPTRNIINQRVAAMRKAYDDRLLKSVWFEWNAIVKGPGSRKSIADNYKHRFEACKAKLIANEATKSESCRNRISSDAVEKCLSSEAFETITMRRSLHMKRIYFKGWCEDFLFSYKQMKIRAENFFKKTLFPSYFYQWMEFVSTVQSEAKVMAIWDPKRFSMEHNQRAILHFSSQNMIRNHFTTWKRLAKQLSLVRIRYMKYTGTLLAVVLKSWAKRAKFQKNVKRVCVNEWRDYDQRISLLPFRAWFVFTKNAQKDNEQNRTIFEAFGRRRRRIILTCMFKTWSHKAIYGKVGGMHTRAELVKALDVQKKLLVAMEVAGSQQKQNLLDQETFLGQEKERSNEYRLDIAEKVEEIIKLKFAVQQIEEEVVRLQTMLDAMSLIHPGTAKRLMASDEKSNLFQDKGVGNIARKMGEKSKMLNGGENQLGGGASTGNICISCGNGPIDHGRPLSARCATEPKYLQRESNYSRVSHDEADMLIRAIWAKEKVKELASKKSRNTAQLQLADQQEMEIQNLRSILAFIWSGDMSDIAVFTQNEQTQKSETEFGVCEVENAKLYSVSNWNDFIQSMSKVFPLSHPVNTDTQTGVVHRIVSAKDNIKNYRKDPSKHKANIYTNH